MTTMVEDARVITGGVGTRAGLHVAAALDSVGGLRGVPEFPATAAGYASLLSWLRRLGTPAVAGVEGDRQLRRGPGRAPGRGRGACGGSGPPRPPGPGPAGQVRPGDAVSAARAALAGRASGGAAGP